MLRPAMTCAVALSAICTDLSHGHALQTRPAPAGALRVERAEIMDRRGFEKPLVAYTMFVPAGWRAEGGVEYAVGQTCGPSQWVHWKATAPDGVGAIEIIPEEKWNDGNFPLPEACVRAKVAAARPYLEWWVQRHRPGARILDYRPRPDLMAQFKGLAMEIEGMRSWADAGEILIAYQHNGRPVRETIASASFYILTQTAPIGNNQSIQFLKGSSAFGFSMRAPEGALSFKTAEALRQSIQAGPEWQQRMTQSAIERGKVMLETNRQMAETNRQAAAERSEIIARTGREVNEIQMGTWRSQNESSDRTQRERIESIRGVETYSDPHYGGTVQLSNQYQHAWQLRDGSYLLTDDVNFDPSRDLGVQGQRLKPAQ